MSVGFFKSFVWPTFYQCRLILRFFFSTLFFYVGLSSLLFLFLMAVSRLGFLGETVFLGHGEIVLHDFAIKFHSFVISLLLLSWVIAYFFDLKFSGSLISKIGILSFFVIGFPMKFSADAILGMMWQMTDPVIISGGFLTFFLISLVAFLPVAYLYRHFSFNEFLGAYSHD